MANYVGPGAGRKNQENGPIQRSENERASLFDKKSKKKQNIEVFPRQSAAINVPFIRARVAELADALDLGSSGETYRGSSPLSRTIYPFKQLQHIFSVPLPFSARSKRPLC
jgi:hypothetical protein